VARTLAWNHDGDVRYVIKHDLPNFNRSLREVVKEFMPTQAVRAKRGEIAKRRLANIKAIIDGPLEQYVGYTQVQRSGDELWEGYPPP
jgi:integrase